MLRKLIDGILWAYWRSQRPFLRAFAEALIGEGKAEFKPNGRAIVGHMEGFLQEVPRAVFAQLILALFLLPVALPPRIPRSDLLRFLVKLWRFFKQHAARVRFLGMSRRARAQYLDRLFSSLAQQAAEEEDDLIKDIVILSNVKSVICGAYMELDSTWSALKYTPYPTRDYNPPSGPDIKDPPRTPTSKLLHQRAVRPEAIARKPSGRTTYCVVGSGAGGAVAAYYIQQHHPEARIILLESGPLVTNDQFSIKVLKASTELFMNAGATLTADQKFTFRQGRCVGGSTAVNNAIALKPEGFWWDVNIVQRWKSVGADLEWDQLYKAYDPIGELINVHPIDDPVITTAAKTVRAGFESLGLNLKIHKVPANLDRCIGCGRCNLGCQYDAKRSMLNTLIPSFVERGGFLVPDAKVVKLNFTTTNGTFRATEVVVETTEGQHVAIEADKIVLASGAYASSKLLWKSGFTGMEPGVRTVGKRFTCNLGSPLIGRFPTPQHAWAGQQVGYVVDVPEERMVIETAFAPPTVLGMQASQWGDRFMKVVEAFDYLAVTAPTVASLSYGQIKKGLLGESGFVIDYALIDEDWRRLTKGMKLSAQAMLAMGVEEIYTTRFDARSLKRGENVERYFAGIGPVNYFKVESAHPQGGNVIHEDPNQGVVDSHLKVHGFRNLWITDASIIPAAITLNLQFTIMALAAYAAPFIVKSD